MNSHSLHELAMPDHPTPDIDVIAPLAGSTNASAEYHREVANRERTAHGFPPHERIELAPDSEIDRLRELARHNVRVFPRVAAPIPSRMLPPKQGERLQEAVDGLVEEYGLGPVIRAVKLIAASNGIEV
jgi:hypothetical protein